MLGGAGRSTAATGIAAYADLRRARSRQRRRVGPLDVAATLVGLVIVGALVGPAVASASASGTAAASAPAAALVVSAVVVTVLGAAVASGGRGGPLALPSAVVFLVLLAPIDRAVVLRVPALRQLAVAAAVGALVGGAVALAAAPRLVDLRLLQWTVAGGLVGTLGLGLSLVVAGLRLRPLAVRLVQVALAAWWAVDAGLRRASSPASALAAIPFGRLDAGLLAWPLVATAVTVALGLARIGGLSVEAAWRRSRYSDQLQLSLGLNDLRTALLVLRRRANEAPRVRPWLALRAGPVVARRDGWSLLRWPPGRIFRFLAFAVVAGASCALAVSTPAAFAVATLLLYAAGLDALDPLAEELDHPHLLASFPMRRGMFLLRHLPVSALVLAGFGLVAAATATALTGAALLAFGLVVPLVLATVAGATLTASRVARPLTTIRDIGLPPEVVGPRILLRVAAPLLPIAATLIPPVLAVSPGGASAASALSTSVGGVLMSVGMIAWSAFGADLVAALGRRLR